MNWISWTLQMLLLVSIFSHSEMIGQMEELSIEILTTGRIPCIHNISPELIDFVGWTKSTSGDRYENGEAYLVKRKGGRIVKDHQDYSIDINFSLVIHNVTTMSMGIYQCTVVPNDATDVSYSESRLTVYKNPEPPSITYEILGDDNIKIDCTHGPVFPLLYPNFPFPFQNNRTILNDDGTYMVSISAVQQFSDSEVTLYCSNSYPGEHQSSFLNVYRSHDGEVYVTTHPSESKTTLKHSSIPTELVRQDVPYDSTSAIIAIAVLTLLLDIIFMTCLVLFIVFRQRVANSIQNLVRAAEKTGIDDAHALFKLMLMLILLMKEMEEVKSRVCATDRQVSRQSGKGSRFAVDVDQGTKDEKRNVVRSLRESPEHTPLLTVNPDEDEDRIDVVRSLRECPEHTPSLTVNPDEDEDRIDVVRSLRESPEHTSSLTVNPDEDEDRIGFMQIVNRLRNIRAEQEQIGMWEELAATLRALQMMETPPSTPPNTEGANIGGTQHVFNDVA